MRRGASRGRAVCQNSYRARKSKARKTKDSAGEQAGFSRLDPPMFPVKSLSRNREICDVSYLPGCNRNGRNSYRAYRDPLASPAAVVHPTDIRPVDSRSRICIRPSLLSRCPLDIRLRGFLLRNKNNISLDYRFAGTVENYVTQR